MLNRIARRGYASRISISHLTKLHRQSTPITCLTAHDYLTARMVDSSPHIDMVLIGDSLAMTALGMSSTVQMDLQTFLGAAHAVSRGIKNKYLIADLPHGSFEASIEKCIESSVTLMKLGNVDAVKIEGGRSILPKIQALLDNGIPVCGHLGLQPQKASILGGYKVQGKTAAQAIELFKEVRMLRDAGVKMLVLECVPSRIAQVITQKLDIITIGIGAGKGTSGQVLVVADMLGMGETKIASTTAAAAATISAEPSSYADVTDAETTQENPAATRNSEMNQDMIPFLPGNAIANDTSRHLPKFVNLYTDIFQIGRRAIDMYGQDVKQGKFPGKDHGFIIKDEEFEEFMKFVNAQ